MTPSSTDSFPSGGLVGIVPAAGFGTRLQPLSGSKETYLINARPVMDFLVERMRRAGCRDIRVVTRPDKTDVIEHANRQGLTVVRANPASVSESLLAGLEGVGVGDLVLFGFPDTIWEPIDGFVRLVAAVEGNDHCDVALGLFVGQEPHRSDVVTIDASGVVTSIAVKPNVAASEWIWGCGVARARVLGALQRDPEPGVVFDSMTAGAGVVGIPLSETFVDIGTREALSAYLRSSDRP